MGTISSSMMKSGRTPLSRRGGGADHSAQCPTPHLLVAWGPPWGHRAGVTGLVLKSPGL